MKPIIKYVGGKSHLVDQLKEEFNLDWSNTRLITPFVGGAAFALSLPIGTRVIANDFSKPLIEMYTGARLWPEQIQTKYLSLILTFKDLTFDEKKVMYYSRRRKFNALLRESNPLTSSQRIKLSALYLFINRTCYNGLMRYNQKGGLNSPVGEYKTYLQKLRLREFSSHTRGWVFHSTGFLQRLMNTVDGDAVYCDPPYIEQFNMYTKVPFTLNYHEMLASSMSELAARGIPVVTSGSNTEDTRRIYGAFNITEVSSRTSVNSKGDKRGKIKELIIKNF